jgi:hypothetical protein
VAKMRIMSSICCLNFLCVFHVEGAVTFGGRNIIFYLLIGLLWMSWISLLWYCRCACSFLAYKVNFFIRASLCMQCLVTLPVTLMIFSAAFIFMVLLVTLLQSWSKLAYVVMFLISIWEVPGTLTALTEGFHCFHQTLESGNRDSISV